MIRILLGLLLSCCVGFSQTAYIQQLESLRQDQSNPAVRLHELFRLHWELGLMESPEFASQIGRLDYNDRWTDHTESAYQRRADHARKTLEFLKSIQRSELNEKDQLNFDLFRRQMETEVEGLAFRDELMPITQLGGIHQSIAQLVIVMPTATQKHYDDILARLNSVPVVVDQTIELMRRGLEQGITPPAVTLRDIPGQVRSQIVKLPGESPILKPFQQFPVSFTDEQKRGLKEKAELAYRTRIVPALEKLHQFLSEEYLPKARKTIAASSLPNGQQWYAYSARAYTTTELTPQQIHDIGQAEVRRIRQEMEAVIKSTGFKGDFRKFCDFLRTDPRFFYKKPEELLAAYRDIAKRADAELPKLFGHLPRNPYGVKPVPSYSEKSQTTAYYQPGSIKAGRPGYFFANTYNLKSRPKWEMEALTLHEAVPGHHLQISIAQELEGLPEFRKYGRFTSYVEGWGLYAESLGTEMGFYTDPYSRFGQLTYEMWRAIRLVVDTGMHSLGWSRSQAIEFFKSNSSKSEHDIVVEIDRYIVWPGQALAYKIGELKLKELRGLAEKQLGSRFDVRLFHDEVLGHGALPMDLLEARVRAWIQKK